MKFLTFPSRIVLELTPLCNLTCFMCPRHYIKKTDGYMSVELYKKLVDEIAIENPQAIILPFWRGESCLHPHFLELIQYSINKKLRIHLSTNGHFMTEEFMNIFYKCEFVTFSIHTDLGYKNAKKFIDNKPEWSNLITQISFVNTEKTAKRYIESCSQDSNLNGFNSIRLYVEHTIDGEFGKNKEKLISKRSFCPKLIHTLVISADGGYSRCNHIWEPEYDQNLINTTIKELWNSMQMNKIRKCYPDKLCSTCDQWTGHTNGEIWKIKEGKIIHKKHGV